MKRLVAVAAASAALLAPVAAHADVRVRSVDASDYPRVRVTIVTSKPSVKRPRLSEDGQVAAGLTAQNLGRAKSIVLAIDRSRSMRGPAMKAAIAAVRRFVREKAPADRLAIVAFGSRSVAVASS